MDTVTLDPRLRHAGGFLSRQAGMLIDGKLVPAASGKTFAVYDPATGATIANVPEGDAEDVNRAVAAARQAFDSGVWAKIGPSGRGKILWQVADLIEKHLEELAELESIDNGKPYAVARVADLPLAVDMFRYMAGWATKITGTTLPLSLPGEYLSYTVREPVGVVGQIIPWNFPLLMAAWKLAPALAAGCTIVLKAAEQTPLSALRLAELIQQSDIPPGVVNILTGFGETAGAAIAAHPDVDKVAFTGSTEVGKLIVHAAAGNLKKVSLELGGKSPAIILPDADLDLAIAGAANAIFFNHGQCCCAGSRLYAHKSVYDKVVSGVADIAGKIKVGPGLDPVTEMGPLVSDEQFARVTGYIDDGRRSGARIAAGGDRVGNLGYFVAPTVLENTTPDMKVIREEIFGPVVCAQPFDDDDLEALARRANDTIYGLAASVWTSNAGMAHKLANRIRSGTVWINCHNVFDASLPFGGYKQSGWGREMGAEVFHNYTEVKAVTQAL
ncbi:MAG TPA: aldehyde dehydrogenase family protein [Rhodopila sp.]|uniref:aldehyde dehydrogenase family protein n=1 Tax=Rhodopila sp. TaxID=2480087 RepID=UPI002C9CB96A|nr:aldehyde dehydrogenase family protein [Rhodopila sp.]HVY15845.1 aldehyde dehydrogenase family protein [Rhodopila sp.]